MILRGTRSQTETRASPLLLLLLVLTATLCQSYNFTLKMFLVRCYREATEKKYKRVLQKKYLKVFFFLSFFPKDMEIPSQIGFQVGLRRQDRWPLLSRLFKCRESNSRSHFHTGLTAEHRSLAPPAVPSLALIRGPGGLSRLRSALMEPLGSPCSRDSSLVYHGSLGGKCRSCRRVKEEEL